MTKTYNFYTKNNNNNTFRTIKSTDYSTILDNIIAADIIDKNSYLFDNNGDIFDSLIDNNHIILTGGATLKASDEFTKAATFLANYKKNKKAYNLPYIIGKMYTLSDGTPIVFYDDEIQIGFDTYKYADFKNTSFLNNLTTGTKKTIVNIFININL